jgi:hypothetical protein
MFSVSSITLFHVHLFTNREFYLGCACNFSSENYNIGFIVNMYVLRVANLCW